MSYILEALNKQDKDGQGQAYRADLGLNQPAPALVIGAKGQSIGWGILLTLAIFAGLFAGYWLGQHNSVPAQQAIIAPQAIKATPANVPAPQAVVSEVKLAAEQQTQQAITEKPTTPVTHIAAEQYFETPPPAVIKASEPERQLVIPATRNVGKDIEYTLVPEPGVSDDLFARFQSAIEDTGQAQDSLDADKKNPDSKGQSADDRGGNMASTATLRALHEMPDWVQKGVPSLVFDQHIYASDGQGWVRVNGKDTYQGDTIATNLVLSEILPQHSVLTYRGESFTLPALATW